MKILFIIPFKTSDEPLGVMYLSSVLKKAGHQTDLAIIETDNAVKNALDFSPDIIAFSITTGAQKKSLIINKQIKEKLPSVLSVFGGPHPTFFQEFINNEYVDVCCLGESEQAFVDLVNAFDRGKKKITKIPNLIVKHNNRIFYNKVRPLISNLDSLPFPDRELLLKYKHYRNSRVSYFLTSRGCPFNCTYCFNHVYKKMYKGSNLVRQRSVDNVIAEIKSVKDKHNLKFVRFVDDNFIISSKWIDEFAKKYVKEINIPFMCYARPELVNDEIAQKLAKAGCISMAIGVEAGNDHVRCEILNRNISKERIIKSVNVIKKNGISVLLQNMVGIPFTTINEDVETLDLNIACKPDYAWASVYQPYPGTKLGELAISSGLFEGNINEIPFTYHSRTVLNLPHKTQLEYLHKLFALAARFPFLKRTIIRAINLPQNKFILYTYNLIFQTFKVYSYSTKIIPVFPKFRREFLRIKRLSFR